MEIDYSVPETTDSRQCFVLGDIPGLRAGRQSSAGAVSGFYGGSKHFCARVVFCIEQELGI